MKKWLAFSLILAYSLALPGVALACETATTAHPGSRCVVLPFKERKGVWFELTLADDLRKLQLEAPELRGQIQSYETVVKHQKFQIDTYREVIRLQEKVVDGFKSTQDHQAREVREAKQEAQAARDKLHAWYRHPAFWAGVGGTVVAAIAISLAVTVK